MVTKASGLAAFNPFKAEFSQNPYPTYHALRELSPSIAVPGCQGNEWIVTSFEDAHAVLTDNRFVVDDLPERVQQMASAARENDSVRALFETLSTWLFFVNEPGHGPLRRILAPFFGKEALRPLRAQIAKIVRELVESAISQDRLDVIAQIARPLPVCVSAAMFDFGDADLGGLTELSAEIFGLFTQPLSLRRYQAINGAILKMRTRIESYLQSQRVRPTCPLAEALIQELDAGTLSTEQAAALCTMIFSVGQDTTQNLIGNAVHALLSQPDHFEAIRRNPELSPAVVREVARFDSPVQLVLRIASETLLLGGSSIKRNERVHVYLGAALRDPKVFANPDILEFDRPSRGSLAFGAGIHFCLGFHLAHLETEVTLEVMAEYLPFLRPTGEPARWIRSVYMRGLQSLPLLACR